MTYSQIAIDVWTRLAFLCESTKQRGVKNVVYLYDHFDTSTFRYRVYNVCQALETSETVRAHFFFRAELQEMRTYWRHVDAAVLARVRWTPELQTVVDQLRAYGTPVYFDVDDLVFDTSYIPLVMNTLNLDMDEITLNWWFSYVSRIDKTASLCDGFISTNTYLSRKLEAKYNRRTWIVPNLLNAEQAETSARLMDREKETRGFRVGYFSGSPTHNNDFYRISYELAAFMRKHDDAELSVVGFLDVPPPLEGLERTGRLTHMPLMGYVELQEAIWATDVNIVPLIVNDFTNCKSALKYFEAALVGVPTIASRTHSYCAAIRDGDNGLLCDPGEWEDALDRIRGSHLVGAKALIEDALSGYLNMRKKEELEQTLLQL
jgi:glycosyltransferase involved in cell wall biosynthesis